MIIFKSCLGFPYLRDVFLELSEFLNFVNPYNDVYTVCILIVTSSKVRVQHYYIWALRQQISTLTVYLALQMQLFGSILVRYNFKFIFGGFQKTLRSMEGIEYN